MQVSNWFATSRLRFVTAIRFMCLSNEITSVKFCMEELNVSDIIIIDWNNYLREICIS
ncbi:hypothetical protein X975_26254, partial [Stegodyphus mimosarum]